MLRPYAASALLVLVLAAGCGGDDPGDGGGPDAPAADDPAAAAVDAVDVAAVREGLVALWVGDDETPEDAATGRCFARALTDTSTPEELRDAGILAPDLTVPDALPALRPEGAALWVDAQFACSDLVAESGRAQVAATKGKVDRAAYEDCLRASVTEEQLREVAERSLLGDLSGDAVTAFSKAQLACVQQALPAE